MEGSHDNLYSRKRFLSSLSIIAIAPVLKSCDAFISNSDTEELKPDIMLEGSEDNIAKICNGQYPLIKEICENPGTEKSIGYKDNSAIKILKISFRKDNLASYPHLRIMKVSTGETVNILWGSEGLYPSIKFVDDKGSLLNIDGIEMEFAIKSLARASNVSSPIDWLVLGMKIFAAALIIWLGASVVKYVAAAIAFIAFNALVLGLVIAGLSLIVPLIKWLLEITGWSINDVKYYFESAVEIILDLLISIQQYILGHP